MVSLAPVLLFTYKRHEVLKETVAALKRNNLAGESTLFIFSDGPRSEADMHSIANVRKFIRSVTGFKEVIIYESVKNKGLANSIIEGVTQVIKDYGKVIVLEDDLVTTPNFLDFMNQALDKYESAKKVFSVSGYSFNLKPDPGERKDAYFLTRGWSWGWATWADRWDKVDWAVKDYEAFKADKTARKEFANGGSDLNAMLDSQMAGTLDSWAIRWFYHQFKIDGLTLYPLFSKINNEGWDENATHTTGSSKRYIPALDVSDAVSFSFPAEIERDKYYSGQFQRKMGHCELRPTYVHWQHRCKKIHFLPKA